MTTIDETTTEQLDQRAAFTAGLRDLADWLDANPDVGLPFPRLAIYSAGYAKGSAITEGADFARAPGRCEKDADESIDRFTLTRRFGPVALVWSAARSAVCEKRTVTKTVEEWVCPDSLLREADERAAAGMCDVHAALPRPCVACEGPPSFGDPHPDMAHEGRA